MIMCGEELRVERLRLAFPLFLRQILLLAPVSHIAHTLNSRPLPPYEGLS